MTSWRTDIELGKNEPKPPPKFLQIQLYNLRKNNDVGKVNLRVDFMIDATIKLQNF